MLPNNRLINHNNIEVPESLRDKLIILMDITKKKLLEGQMDINGHDARVYLGCSEDELIFMVGWLNDGLIGEHFKII